MKGTTLAAVIALITGGTAIGVAGMLRRAVFWLVVFFGLSSIIGSFKGDIATAYNNYLKSSESRQASSQSFDLERQRLVAAQLELKLNHEVALRKEQAKQEEVRSYLAFLKEQVDMETRAEEKMTRRERDAYRQAREQRRQEQLLAEERRVAQVAAELAAQQVRQNREVSHAIDLQQIFKHLEQRQGQISVSQR